MHTLMGKADIEWISAFPGVKVYSMGGRLKGMRNEVFRQVHRYSNPAPILVFQHTKGRHTGVDAHWHDDLEINLVSKGRVRFYVGGQVKERWEGRFCLVSSGEVHSAVPVSESSEDVDTGITLLIQHDFLTSVIPNYDNITFVDPQKEEEERIVAYLAEIEELYEGQRDVSVSVRILGLVCQILSVLLDRCAIEKGSVDVNYWKDSERQKIILDYIHSNYDQPLRQGELAEKFHFSKEYFCRFFKRYTGQTFKEYLTGCRLIHAERMLRNSGSSIVEIAHRNGFPDEQSFIRAFKNQYKESPGKYRKALIER